MEQGAIFRSNRSQAVRLPKAAAFPEGIKRVDVIVLGRTRILAPAGESWDSWFDGESVSDDYMTSRDQPADQERDAF